MKKIERSQRHKLVVRHESIAQLTPRQLGSIGGGSYVDTCDRMSNNITCLLEPGLM
jgi:hypothetical protein